MNKRIVLQGLNKTEYEAFKKAARTELPFTVNIRICKRQYALGAIDIRPKNPERNNNHWYTWTEEEFSKVLDFLKNNNMLYTTSGAIDDTQANQEHGFSKFQMQHIIHGKGFHFLMKVAS